MVSVKSIFSLCLVLRSAALTSFVLALPFVQGCDNEPDEVSKVRKQEEALKTQVSRIPREIEGLDESLVFATNLVAQIERLPTVELKKKWYYKAQDEVFKIDISHLSYTHQYRCIHMFTEYLSKISAGEVKYENYISPWRHNYSRIWQLRIRSLIWKKKQLDRLRNEYEKEKMRPKVVPVPESTFNRVTSLQYLVEDSVESEYDAYMAMVEQCWWSDKEWMKPEEREIVKREFEAYLGRPIRTEEQICEDHRRRTEARRKRDEARAKKNAGRVILLDGSK